MSQKDKVTFRRGKIVEVLTKYGSLSTAQITKVINDKYGFHYNHKTIERDIFVMQKEGIVTANPPVGREQTYSASKKPVLMSEFFINQFWKNLDSIRHLNASEDSITAFYEIRSLIKMLPIQIYEQLEPDLEKASKWMQKWFDENKPVVVSPTGLGGVEYLIRKVSAVLHGQFEKLQKEKKDVGC